MKMYFIALVLPHDIDLEIQKFKQLMFDKYKCKVGLKSPAHITLVPPFWMEEENEQAIKSEMDYIVKDQKSIILRTADFSAFKPRTIFVAVEENHLLKELKEKVESYFVNKDFKIKKESRPFHPHITIATRDLYKKDFAEAWPYFNEKVFKEDGLLKVYHFSGTMANVGI